MATIYFTSNADSGDGTLRDAMTNASAGDIIAPDPTAFSGVSEITIQLSSGLPLVSVSIVGAPNQRIILDRQSSGYFFRVATGNRTLVFSYVDFANGSRTTNLESPFYIGTVNGTSVTFNNCKFYNNFGYYAGFLRGVAGATNTTLTFNNCLAYNNRHDQANAAADFMAFQSAANPTIVFNGCTIDASEGNQSFTNLSSYPKNDCIYKTTSTYHPEGLDPAVDFVDYASNDYRLAPGSVCLTGGSLTGTDILGHTRTGSIGAYDGSWFVVPANGTATIASNITVDYAEIGAGATVNFSAANLFLSVKKSASIASSVLSAPTGGNGYLAVPVGTNISAATLTRVKAAAYGAGVDNLDYVYPEVFYAATDMTIPVLLEYRVGESGAWTTVANIAESPYEYAVTSTRNIRLFDGIGFYTAVAESPEPGPGESYYELAAKTNVGYLVTKNLTGYLKTRDTVGYLN